jgi:predicted dehydrogenase
LLELGYKNITIVDLFMGNQELIDENFDYYFVATPFETHFDVLSKLSKFKNKKIWCEKPLSKNLNLVKEIYKKIESNNNKLFVDWVYVFNPCVRRIKEIIKNKKIKQIILNRTNSGPVRFDCSSIEDLSSHDISIINFLFDENNFKYNFNEFSINGDKNGSNISWVYHDGLQIIINSSWEHNLKNRISFLITEKDEIISFNDIDKTINNSGNLEFFDESKSPIQLSMSHFFENSDFTENKKLTIKITKDLENFYEHKIQ